VLSALATALVDGQIFAIAQAMLDVQHATEKQLFAKRLDFQKSQQGFFLRIAIIFEVNAFFLDEKRAFDAKYQESIVNAATADVLALTAKLDSQRTLLAAKRTDDLRKFDADLVLQLDQKVMEQQMTLEKAGVPGFKVQFHRSMWCGELAFSCFR